LDGTIIKTKSGKVFPIGNDDWEPLYNNTANTINNLDAIVGIISNQKGIKSDVQLKAWQHKLDGIMKLITNIHFIFASTADNRYRKPMIGSWEYIKESIFLGITLPEEITYVGDACGRNTDHSDTDIKFALNNNFKFSTPEKFFKIKVPRQDLYVTYPNLEYYTITKFNNLFDKVLNELSNDKVFIMLIGFPGVGKSFIRKLIMDNNSKYKYTNKDDITNKVINNNLLKNKETSNYIINDNTNMNDKNRNIILKEYNNYHKIGIFFDYSIELSVHLNYMRMYWYGVSLISKVVYNTINKSYTKPTSNTFDTFITFDKILPQLNFKDSSMKYFY